MHSLKNTIVAVGLLGLSFVFYQFSSPKPDDQGLTSPFVDSPIADATELNADPEAIFGEPRPGSKQQAAPPDRDLELDPQLDVEMPGIETPRQPGPPEAGPSTEKLSPPPMAATQDSNSQFNPADEPAKNSRGRTPLESDLNNPAVADRGESNRFSPGNGFQPKAGDTANDRQRRDQELKKLLQQQTPSEIANGPESDTETTAGNNGFRSNPHLVGQCDGRIESWRNSGNHHAR